VHANRTAPGDSTSVLDGVVEVLGEGSNYVEAGAMQTGSITWSFERLWPSIAHQAHSSTAHPGGCVPRLRFLDCGVLTAGSSPSQHIAVRLDTTASDADAVERT
jgi:hypothetical protein